MSGWLKNPFNTTRKMKVDYHQHIGHRERMTNTLFIWILRIAIAFALVMLWFQIKP